MSTSLSYGVPDAETLRSMAGLAFHLAICEGALAPTGALRAECRILDAAGRLLAHGATTCMILELPEATR